MDLFRGLDTRLSGVDSAALFCGVRGGPSPKALLHLPCFREFSLAMVFRPMARGFWFVDGGPSFLPREAFSSAISLAVGFFSRVDILTISLWMCKCAGVCRCLQRWFVQVGVVGVVSCLYVR